MSLRKFKSSLAGIVFIVFSSLLFFLYKDEQLAMRAAFSGFLIGIFLLFMSVRYTVPEQISGKVIESTTSSLYNMLDGLNLKGKGIFIPPSETIKSDKVYVPLHKEISSVDHRLMDEQSVFINDSSSSSIGVFLNSPGTALVELYEKESETIFKGIGAEMLCEILKVVEGLDIVSSLDADHDDGILKISFTHSVFGDSCDRIRNDYVDICERSCCPICSSILSSFARAEGKPVIIKELKKGKKVRIKAEYLDNFKSK